MLIILDSVSVNRNLTSDHELVYKNHLYDELDKNTVLRFNQKLKNYSEVSVGSDVYGLLNMVNYKLQKKQYSNILSVEDIFQNLVIKCNDKNNGKLRNFTKSTETKSPTGYSGTTGLPPIGDSFMYVETSSNNHGNVFIRFEGADFIQYSNITFYYRIFSFK